MVRGVPVAVVVEAAGFLEDAGEFDAKSIFSGAVGGARLSFYGHRGEWYYASAGSQVCVRGPDGVHFLTVAARATRFFAAAQNDSFVECRTLTPTLTPILTLGGRGGSFFAPKRSSPRVGALPLPTFWRSYVTVSRRDTLKIAQPFMAGGGECVQTESRRDG